MIHCILCVSNSIIAVQRLVLMLRQSGSLAKVFGQDFLGLKLETRKYFCINYKDQNVFYYYFQIIINVLDSHFGLIWIPIYFMGIRPLYMFYSFNAGIDVWCQTLTSNVWTVLAFKTRLRCIKSHNYCTNVALSTRGWMHSRRLLLPPN